MRPLLASLMLLFAIRADAQQVILYANRMDEPRIEPFLGEETVLGGFVEGGQHLGVNCHRKKAGIEAEILYSAQWRDNPKLSGRGPLQGLMESGECFLAAFGTPVTVLRFDDFTGPDGMPHRLLVVRMQGGPHQNEEVYIWPHDTLRRRSKEEIVAERRSPRLPGATARPHEPEPGELLMLGRMDLKSPVPDVHKSGIVEYPVLELPIPAFASLGAFRDHFTVKKEKEGARGVKQAREGGLPVTTRVYVVEIVPATERIPAAAVVSIAFGPAQGERFLVPAADVLKYSRVLFQVPDWNPRRAADYSPATDRFPSSGHAKTKHVLPADHKSSPPDAETLLQMGRGTERTGHPAGALQYYGELIEKFPDSPQAVEARGRVKALGKR